MRRKTTDEFISEAKAVHGERYNYDKSVYLSAHTKLIIVCPEHKEFLQTPHNHLRGQGCPLCGNKKKGACNVSNTWEFINKAKVVHGEKYDYSKVEYINNRVKIKIICPVHGEFIQKPLDHLHGCGCPLCGNKLNLSEMKVFEELRKVFKNVKRQYTTDWLKTKTCPFFIDFYLPDEKVAIEYQGRQHFRPIDRFGGEEEYDRCNERDRYKYNQCKAHGVRLYYISFEKDIPKNYISTIYTNIEDLVKEIKDKKK